jgi:hypothetical protein
MFACPSRAIDAEPCLSLRSFSVIEKLLGGRGARSSDDVALIY